MQADSMSPGDISTDFNSPDHWNPLAWQRYIADQERAMLASTWLPGAIHSVLDIGCGNGIFANLADLPRNTVGLDLSRAALVNVVAPHVQADAANIPFEENAFDVVVSMELLEHLPQATYPIALSELVRVAGKYILVSVPYKENLNYGKVTCPKCLHTFHQYLHLRQYTAEKLNALFRPKFLLERLEAIISTQVEWMPSLWHLISQYMHRKGRNFPTGLVCPQCGFSLKGTPASKSRQSTPRLIRRTLHAFWPKTSTFTWWMAFYRRAT
jgi:SAM-dependent methyltransferase